MIPDERLQKARGLAWRASMKGLPRGPHVTRYYMYDRIRSIGRVLTKRTGRVLAISHSANLAELLALQPTETVLADYPDHNILALDFPDAPLITFLSDQVLEHIEGDPYQAVSECHRVLRKGGIALHTTCFINPIHGAPRDFWRFTPEALSLLHRDWAENHRRRRLGQPFQVLVRRRGPVSDSSGYHTQAGILCIDLPSRTTPCWPIRHVGRRHGNSFNRRLAGGAIVSVAHADCPAKTGPPACQDTFDEVL
jgi:SAM-dependent methyltransferase